MLHTTMSSWEIVHLMCPLRTRMLKENSSHTYVLIQTRSIISSLKVNPPPILCMDKNLKHKFSVLQDLSWCFYFKGFFKIFWFRILQLVDKYICYILYIIHFCKKKRQFYGETVCPEYLVHWLGSLLAWLTVCYWQLAPYLDMRALRRLLRTFSK